MPARPGPSSTYRLQITADFPLADAAALTGYLSELGVGAVYLSPVLRSTSGSTHGYDVVDHREIDPARGGEAGFRALADACRQSGLGLVVDIVPNHMGVAAPEENAAWWDVLRLGQDSAYARWFDIDWRYGDGRILIPVLGDDADPDSELQVVDGELRYYEHRYPIAPGTAEDGESPAKVHDRQHYQLVSFRKADTEQNYRRFFAVTDLAGLRVEDEEVYRETHREILRWRRDFGVTGIRIDHPDGLVDPAGYLERLAADAPEAWITVEKITEPGEELPPGWPVAGMTGYDALAEVNELLVDPAAEGTLSALYAERTGDTRDWAQHVEDGKRMVAGSILQAEVRRLGRLVPDVDDAVPALAELVIAFPVYRSYLPEGREHLAQAAELARSRRPELTAAIDSLLPRLGDPTDELALRFQQVTGAVMAKGVEDTAYYRYTRFLAANEVGGDPGRFGSGVVAFHEAARRRQQKRPAGMTTLSTHDTKRGEDVRASLAVLAEISDEWNSAVTDLLTLAPVPNRAFGYLLWQTFAATGLIDRVRMHAYAEKAMREAADGTGWIDPDPDFEAAVHNAVDAAYDRDDVRRLVVGLSDRVRPHGWVNAISQKLIQLTMPGIPDVYQGTELWDDSLVDPDNRRPVDFAARTEALRALAAPQRQGSPPGVDSSGAAKLWIVRQALRARRDNPDLFTDYQPLYADGPAQDHLVAFDRGGAVTLATRLPLALDAAGGWRDTTLELPAGRYRDALTGTGYQVSPAQPTGGEPSGIALADLLRRYPVALLLRVDAA